jgi:predicted nucleotidyltransferase component of viral defense system
VDKKIREIQKEILGVFSRYAEDFALSGETALELYYLHHRFSVDLDFFSPKYKIDEIDKLIKEFEKIPGGELKLESELMAENKAKIRFYTISLKGSERPLKIDFVEDIIFDNPEIKNFDGVRVYGAENIYLQKLIAITGTRIKTDHIGRKIIEGRREARDIFDLYLLSKKVKPLHIFLQNVPGYIQRGIIQWYRRFSRRELKLALFELDIYDKKFDSKKMIIYLENEIKRFIQGVVNNE